MNPNPPTMMNLLDILIVACMGFLIVRGVFRGFVREVGSLAGVIVGIWAACVHHPQMTAFLTRFLPAWNYLPLLSVALIVVMVLAASNILAWLLHMFLKKVLLGWVDRTLGMGLAVLKGIIIIYFSIVLMTFFVPSQASFMADSRLAPLIVRSYQAMVGLISPETYDNLRKRFMSHKEKALSTLTEPKEKPSEKHGR